MAKWRLQFREGQLPVTITEQRISHPPLLVPKTSKDKLLRRLCYSVETPVPVIPVGDGYYSQTSPAANKPSKAEEKLHMSHKPSKYSFHFPHVDRDEQ